MLTTAALLMSACSPTGGVATSRTMTALPSPTTTRGPNKQIPPTTTATPQVTSTPATYGPEAGQFPAGINPLTGLRAVDPSLLKIPAVLVSVSHFPAAARPQAGLSFAPFVYEFSITGGETRFLTTFYGQFPAPEVPANGGCQIRGGTFKQTATLLGNQVWMDSNRNGVQDPGEGGIPGICVSLYDTNGHLLSSTTTDSNGMYGFNVASEQAYVLRFVRPANLDFTGSDVGNDDTDSDVDPSTGATPAIYVHQSTRLWDAGLFPDEQAASPTPDTKLQPRAEVGPVRSGRLLYIYIAGFYQNSCLIYAFASPEVLEKLPHCAFVAHEEVGGGEMLSIDRMKAVAEDNMRHMASHPFDYSSNVYSELPPSGGVPTSQVSVFFGNLNQSGWTYDPLYQAYLRYVDTADPKARGVLHADIDRLTGRQVHFENVIVVMADTDVITSTNIDIHLDEGNTGPGVLFRDGKAFPITWSTRAGKYEKNSGFRRAIQYLNPDGSPEPLKPGHSWVIIVTPYSVVQSQPDGVYSVRYGAPAGEAR